MGIITLTDRISVRVSAKNDTQSNDYKKATGGAIASKLGNGNVSDSLKSQLGNTKNPTITDENGDTWVSMEDMIAAGKAMNGDGAFAKPHYKYDENLTIYRGPLQLVAVKNKDWSMAFNKHIYTVDYDCEIYARTALNNITIASRSAITETKNDSWTPTSEDPQYQPGEETTTKVYSSGSGDQPVVTVNVSSIFGWGLDALEGADSSAEYGTYLLTPLPPVPQSDTGLSPGIARTILYGDTEWEGGSSYDWTKSDSEIEEDIRDQEEVWDVIQNAVSSSSPTAKIPVGPYVNVGHIDDSWDSGSGGGHTGGDF